MAPRLHRHRPLVTDMLAAHADGCVELRRDHGRGQSLDNGGEEAMSEASIHSVGGREPLRSIIARPIVGGAVHTIIGPEPGQRGPWSFLTDTPHLTRDMVGLPATYLAIAAWAA
jgi:hypothetical protein